MYPREKQQKEIHYCIIREAERKKFHRELCINTSFIFNQSPSLPITPQHYDSQKENMHPNSQIVPPAPTNQTQSPSRTGFNYLTELFTNHIVSPTNQCSNDETNGSKFDNSQLCTPCTPLTLNDRFAAEFGKDNTVSVLKKLEQDRPKLHSSSLQREYDTVPCSTLTRYLWTQAEKQNSDKGFESIDKMYKWVRKNLKVEILTKGNVSSRMKTARSKRCSLCLAERIYLYYELNHHDKERSKKLMNQKTEIYGKCTCTTRFLRLMTDNGKVGADEATG